MQQLALHRDRLGPLGESSPSPNPTRVAPSYPWQGGGSLLYLAGPRSSHEALP